MQEQYVPTQCHCKVSKKLMYISSCINKTVFNQTVPASAGCLCCTVCVFFRYSSNPKPVCCRGHSRIPESSCVCVQLQFPMCSQQGLQHGCLLMHSVWSTLIRGKFGNEGFNLIQLFLISFPPEWLQYKDIFHK